MLDGMRLFGMGYSWGGYESLMVPAGLDHQPQRQAVARRRPHAAHPCRPRGSRRPDRRSRRRPWPGCEETDGARPQDFLDSVAFDAQRPGAGDRAAARHRRGADDGLDEPRRDRGDAEHRPRLLLVALARQPVAQGRDLRPGAAPGRVAHRLRQRLPAAAGRPDRRRLPHRPPLLLLHRDPRRRAHRSSPMSRSRRTSCTTSHDHHAADLPGDGCRRSAGALPRCVRAARRHRLSRRQLPRRLAEAGGRARARRHDPTMGPGPHQELERPRLDRRAGPDRRQDRAPDRRQAE